VTKPGKPMCPTNFGRGINLRKKLIKRMENKKVLKVKKDFAQNK